VTYFQITDIPLTDNLFFHFTKVFAVPIQALHLGRVQYQNNLNIAKLGSQVYDVRDGFDSP
jgi:hypothetical protein